MPINHEFSLKAFGTFLTSLNKLGPEISHTILQEEIERNEKDTDKSVHLIFSTVCKEFAVTREEIQHGVSKDGRRHNALVCLVFLFVKYTTLAQSDISILIRKSQGLVSQLKKERELLDENHKEQKEIVKKIMFCDKKVEEKIKINNSLTTKPNGE